MAAAKMESTRQNPANIVSVVGRLEVDMSGGDVNQGAPIMQLIPNYRMGNVTSIAKILIRSIRAVG